jgi:UDP-N-acetylglucosamine 2-epimerase
LVGDVRVDVIEYAKERSASVFARLEARAGVERGRDYAFCTIHRASNTDDPGRLKAILTALGLVPFPVVLPVHPRLKGKMQEFGLAFPDTVRTLSPTSFFETIALMKEAALILTDSGGLQKEAYMLKKPTITLRDTTEWTETVDAGWNRLSEPDEASMLAALEAAKNPPTDHPNLYGERGVAERIAQLLEAGPT